MLDPSRIYLACNAQFYKYFEYESFGRSIPVRQIVNSGRSLGDNRVDWRTVSLALREAASSTGPRDVLLLSADSVPPANFQFGSILRVAQSTGCSTILTQACSVGSGGPVCKVGVLKGRVSSISLSTTTPAIADDVFSPIFYYLVEADVKYLLSPEGEAAVVQESGTGSSSFGEPVLPVEAAVAALVTRGKVVAIPLSNKFILGAMNGAPHVALTRSGGPYAHALPSTLSHKSLGTPYHAKGFARVGLLGNPSDGYGGKTLAVTVENFYAEAWITPIAGSSAIHLIPHPVGDPLRYPSLAHLSTLSSREGYSGGLRLMAAALHRFHVLCTLKQYPLNRSRGFTARYHTTVPRQVGLAGSSAIITAFLRAVFAFYGLSSMDMEQLELTRDTLPAFVLSIESDELGITAGLQDRVVQVSYAPLTHPKNKKINIALTRLPSTPRDTHFSPTSVPYT